MSDSVRLTFAPEVVLLAALAAGLATSYGRELHGGRRPGWRWWLSMLLLLPTVAIMSQAAALILQIDARVNALLTVMLVLSGYKGLEALVRGWTAQTLRISKRR